MKEIVKFKQGFKPKGKVTVQLFDENGQMINEQKSDNFIAKGVETYYDQLMRDIFTRDRGVGRHGFDSLMQDLFNSVELRDATHAEDPENEWLQAGNVIGYAYTTGSYSGSDPLRGSYNTSESFTNREQVHIVVDFPTHAGNGTFQSVYFTKGRTSLKALASSAISEVVYLKIIKHNNNMYGYVDGNRIDVLNDDFEIIESINPTSINANDFCIAANQIYYSTPSGIYSANLSNPEAVTHIDVNVSGVRGIIYNSLMGRWFVSKGLTIEMYDDGWNLINTYSGLTANNQSNNKVVAATAEGVLTSYGDFVRVGGIDDGQIVRFSEQSYNRSDLRYSGMIDNWLHYSENYSNSSNRGSYRIPKTNIGSRALLDQPVIKTANNTMKVTYDFMLPSSF